MAQRRKISALVIGVCSLALAGCLYEPTNFTTERVQVEEKPYSDTIPVTQFNEAAVEAAAQHYRKHGDGPLELVVTYDPKSKAASAMHAADTAGRLAGMFRKNGVKDIQTNILPVNDAGDEMRAMLSYNSFNALAPKDCDVMPGIGNRNIDAKEDYKLGCSIETMYARQVARPKDLKGQGVDETTDGRRSSNIVERYRVGEPNKPLEGKNASGD